MLLELNVSISGNRFSLVPGDVVVTYGPDLAEDLELASQAGLTPKREISVVEAESLIGKGYATQIEVVVDEPPKKGAGKKSSAN